MSQRTSSAHATIASPRCAVGGPSGGAGTENRASNVSPAPSAAGITGARNASSTNSRPFASTQFSVLLVLLPGRMGLALALLDQAQADEPERGLARGDRLGRGEAQRPVDPLAHAHRMVEHELGVDPARGRAHELIGSHVMERVRPLRPPRRVPLSASNGCGQCPWCPPLIAIDPRAPPSRTDRPAPKLYAVSRRSSARCGRPNTRNAAPGGTAFWSAWRGRSRERSLGVTAACGGGRHA